MTKYQAINLNPQSASLSELYQATVQLKSSYTRSVKAFERHGYENEMMKTMQAREEVGQINSKPLGQMTRDELKSEFVAYRDYSAHRVYDENDNFLGFDENQTATWKGFKQYQEKVGKDILGDDQYSKMTQDEQRDLWDFINDIREAKSGYFKPGSGAYGSGTNIKKVTEYYNKGYTKEEAIKLLTGEATEAKLLEEMEREMRVPSSPMFLVNKDNF